MKDEPESFLGELRLSRHLQSIAQVSALGLAIALGLSFIIPAHVIIEGGIRSATPALLAILILGLTLLNIHELLGGSGERGGIHALIHESLGKSMGFIAAWSSFAANLLLCAALLKSASRSLAVLLPEIGSYATMAAVAMLIILVLINLFHLLPRRGMLTSVLLVLLVVFVALLISAIPSWEPSSYPALSDSSAKNYLLAVASSITLFAGLEAITSSRRRILMPHIRLPQGLWVTLLVGGLLLIAVQFFVPALPSFSLQDGPAAVTRSLAGAGIFRTWLTTGVALFALLLAASECMLTSARVLYSLSRMGALPRFFTRIHRPFRLPPFIFCTLTLMGSLLILLMPFGWLIEISAGLFLVLVVLVNFAAIRSRQAEPERRRAIVIPFFPLVPILALTLSIVIFFGLVPVGLLGTAGWIAIGSALLLVYARSHLLEAQHGVTVFGQDPETKRQEGAFRILVPLGAGGERRFILGLATALARQTNGDVIPLQVIPTADPLAIQDGRRVAEERNTLFKWSTRESARNSVPTYPITRLASSVAQGINDTAVEENCSLILMAWRIETPREGIRTGRILDPVVHSAPCDVAVVAYHPERLASLQVEDGQVDGNTASPSLKINRILIPTAGGPHAPLAMRLALLLAREFDATTQTVYVTRPDATESELEGGRQRIENTIEALREQLSSLPQVDAASADMDQFPIESHVVSAHTVVDGIVQAGSESDLVIMGASEESLIDQVLFGALPEKTARACPTPVIMIKSFRGLPRFWLRRVWDGFFRSLPKLTRSEQAKVYRGVYQGAQPDTDYFVMMGLAAMIATYGLLQGSTAVIIGAMLVAPLFTPILAISLAIVRGDVRLLWIAFESALKGIALAIGLAFLLTAISPLRTVTHEITARINPNLFDLAVALVSGVAGAYAVAREDVSTALPGVAIAAALVPPLGVIGIGIAMWDANIAGGASLLFITNLIAIAFAGAITLLLLGFRPTPGAEQKARLRVGLITSLVMLIAIMVPLAIVFIDTTRESQTFRVVDSTLQNYVETNSSLRLVRFDVSEGDGEVNVDVTLNAFNAFSVDLAESLREELVQALDRPVTLHLVSIPAEDITIPSPE
ncbi:MAG: DUF389 domain-containing protein [Anaerolineales bacterium]|nr:DUF389 domain-containing protein [Anaerolineales bacterium]